MTDINVGGRYVSEELPENEMNNSGKLEWVSDDILALSNDGYLYEFKMAVECTSIAEFDENGELNVIEGELR